MKARNRPKWQKKKKNSEAILELWTNLKEKLLPLIKNLTHPPTELLTQITSLAEQINQIKQDNPDWEGEYPQGSNSKNKIFELEIQKSILSQKLAYQQNWTTDKELYENQLTVSNSKLAELDKKLDKVRDLVADNQIPKLKQLLKEGKI